MRSYRTQSKDRYWRREFCRPLKGTRVPPAEAGSDAFRQPYPGLSSWANGITIPTGFRHRRFNHRCTGTDVYLALQPKPEQLIRTRRYEASSFRLVTGLCSLRCACAPAEQAKPGAPTGEECRRSLHSERRVTAPAILSLSLFFPHQIPTLPPIHEAGDLSLGIALKDLANARLAGHE